MSTASDAKNQANGARAADLAVDAAIETLRTVGATGEVAAGVSETWSAQVRLGEVESVQGATTRGLRITAFGDGGRKGTVTTTEVGLDEVRSAARKAAELAAYGDPDPWAGLPPASECGEAEADLEADDPAYPACDREALLGKVLEAERIALARDPRIDNAHRSSVQTARGEHWYASTEGVRVRRAGTSFSYSVVVVAKDGSERQVGAHGTRARHLSALKTPEEVGSEAGDRAICYFGWRKPPTGRFPVIFDNEMASSLLGTLASAMSGTAVYKGSTYLAGRLGETVTSPVVTVVDDPLIPRGLGSRTCDGEGVRSRRLVVVDGGRLATYLVDGYAARRLKHPYTGHDGGCSNLILVPGSTDREAMLTAMGTGLLVNQVHGFGINLANGSYSKGVSGFWVENGRLAHPVQDTTIAGNLSEIWPGIRLVGDDPREETAVSSPGLLIDGFTIGGG